MRKSLAGLAGIVLLSVCAGCGPKKGVEIPQEKTIYRTENKDGTYSYFNEEKQNVNLVDVELAGKKDDFVSFDDKLYEKMTEGETSQEPEQREEPQQPEPTEPEYVTNKEFQTMQENYNDRFNTLDEYYKELRNNIHEIKKILKKNSECQPRSSSDLVPVQPKN